MKNQNKKAWILIVESVIAILILFGFLFITIAKQPQQTKTTDKSEFLYDLVNELAIKAVKNDGVRTYVLEGDESAIKIWLTDEINNDNIQGDALVCNIGAPCTLDIEAEEIYTSEVIISTDSETYDIKKLKIFIW